MEIPLPLVIAPIICLVVVKFLSTLWLSQRKFYALGAKFEQPPGYSCYPLIGHAHHYASLEAPYGVVYVGTRIFYFLNDADLLEDCLTNDKCLNKPQYLDILKHIEGGLFMAKGNIWKAQRKLLNHGFKQSTLNFYCKKFTKHDQRFLTQLEDKIGEIFDINELSKKVSFQKYFDCAFGLDFDTKSDEYLKALDDSVSLSQARVFSFTGCVELLNKITPHSKAYRTCLKTLTRITQEIVDERLKKFDKPTEKHLFDEENEFETTIFIDYVLECIKNNKYNKKNLVSELITFAFAGVDTCSSTFSYVCLCLSIYPDIQRKVYDEICRVMGDRPFHHSDYQHLKYLHMVIKETMRIFPPGPIIHRQTTDDVKIGDHIFPKNSILQINIINVQRSAKYYENPLNFNPERFAPGSEMVKNRHQFAYIPFSGGRRGCIGEKFGMLLLVSTLATILKKFGFETTYNRITDIRLEQRFTLAAVDGYPVRIYRR